MILEAGNSFSSEPALTRYIDGLFAGGSNGFNDMAVREVASALEAYACAEGGGILESGALAIMASSAANALGRTDLADEAFLIGSGIIYPQKLTSVEGLAVWVINTTRLFPDLSACTELGVFSVFHRLVGRMAHLWDGESGQGALGVRKMRNIARVLAGGSASKRQVVRSSERLIDALAQRLAQCAAGRGWSRTPDVLMLD